MHHNQKKYATKEHSTDKSPKNKLRKREVEKQKELHYFVFSQSYQLHLMLPTDLRRPLLESLRLIRDSIYPLHFYLHHTPQDIRILFFFYDRRTTSTETLLRAFQLFRIRFQAQNAQFHFFQASIPQSSQYCFHLQSQKSFLQDFP